MKVSHDFGDVVVLFECLVEEEHEVLQETAELSES